MGESSANVRVTLESCQRIEGPFFHGTKVALWVASEARRAAPEHDRWVPFWRPGHWLCSGRRPAEFSRRSA